MKNNILVISSHMPSLKIPQAGQKIIFNFLKELSESYNVFLITFRNNFEKEYADIKDLDFCQEVKIIDVSLFDKFFNILINPFLPLRVGTRKSKRVEKIIKNYINLYKFEKIHFEFTSAMGYLDLFDIKASFLQVTEHDITYQSYIRKYTTSSGLKKICYKFEYLRFKKWELNSLRKMSKIIVLNNKDAELLKKENYEESKIEVKHPFVNSVFFKARQDKREKNSLLFWGALNRIENEDAVVWFLTDILPIIKQNKPNIKIYIVGNMPSNKVKSFQSTNIIVTGFVENPIEYFEKATLAIAPLRLGAGIKIKVLESLAAGLKVISTSVGAEGIDDEKIIIADSEDEFSLKILENL